MKTLLFTTLAIVLLLSSCSKEELNDTTNLNSIDFRTFVGKTTKAVDATLATLQADGINVYAWKTAATVTNLAGTTNYDADFMNEVAVTYSAPNWTYSPPKYWPASGYLQFLAIGDNVTPAADAAVNDGEYFLDADGSGDPSIKYCCSNVPSEQKDLLFANVLDATKATGTVSFNFSHLLSKIDIRAKADCDDPNMQLKITSITFTNVCNTGINTLTTGLWGSTANPETVAVGLNGFTQNGNAGGNSFANPQAADGGLIIIPQTMGDIEVEYQYLQKDYDGNYTQVIVDCTGANKKTIDLGSSSWEKGKKYIYDLTFTFDNSGSLIVFDVASVTDWTDGGTTSETIN